MNDQSKLNQAQSEEETLHRLFKAVGPRQDAPADIKQKWAATARLELDDVIKRRRRRKVALSGIAASVFLIGLVFTINLSSPEPRVVAELIRQSGNAYLVDGNNRRSIDSSKAIIKNSELQTTNDSYIALSYRNAVVRLNQNTVIILGENKIELISGEIYIDNKSTTDDDTSGTYSVQNGITVETPVGSVRDIGTQFLVKYNALELVTSVRQGAIELDVSGKIHHAQANNFQAESFRVLKNNEVQPFTQPSHNAPWEWIHKVTPSFDLEGSSTYNFLQWSCLETGLQLEFATESTRLEALETILHGQLPQLDIYQAIDLVMATTALQAVRKGSTLYVDERHAL
jgi:hypothetical protein